MTDGLTEDDGEWPDCTRYVVWPVARLPPLKPGDLDRSETARDLDCMRRGIPLGVRLRRLRADASAGSLVCRPKCPGLWRYVALSDGKWRGGRHERGPPERRQ